MSTSLATPLVIGISATALFDLREAQAYFDARLRESPATAVADYRAWMREREQQPLADGTGMPLVRALLALNAHAADGPLVDVVVLSRNSLETGVQVFNNIRRLQLPITRHAFTGGESVVDYLSAFSVDLFLTTHAADAQRVIDEGHRAAAILRAPPPDAAPFPAGQVRIAFDGDAVLFDDSSELVYKSQGLAAFQRHEDSRRDEPMTDGPYALLLRKLAQLQARLVAQVQPGATAPLRIALITARSAPAEMRVINTLRHWGVQVDEVFFLGGLGKDAVLRAFRPHIFFDDQDVHLDAAARAVSAGKVPWRSGSGLQALRKQD
ncbi:MAG: 5'-nucleotidase [Gammaproteobacteria bacterium]